MNLVLEPPYVANHTFDVEVLQLAYVVETVEVGDRQVFEIAAFH